MSIVNRWTCGRWALILFAGVVLLCHTPARADYYEKIVELNPVAYWRLGETSGSTAWDEAGAYHGTYYGPLLDQNGTIRSNKAAWFDGADDYVDVGTPTVGGSAITITAWIKPDSFSNPRAGIVSKKRIWTVLLVVVSPASLSGQEASRKTLLDSWGYRVNLIAASDTQANFNTAVELADAAYVSSTISDTQLGTKLKLAPIGVVNEKLELADTFGFASDFLSKSRAEIRIVNNSHYITTGYTVGSLITIVSSSQPLGLLNSTYAGGLNVLTETFNVGIHYKPSLSTINSGGALYGGGTAVARRVMLPWGGATFDINSLNVDGRTVMRRSVDWAAGRDSADAELQRHVWSLTTATSGGNTYLSATLETGGTSEVLDATSGALEFEKWAFAAAVYDGSNFKIYKDGVEVASTSCTGSLADASTVPVWIGSQPAVAAGFAASPFHGTIDEVAIFSQALTPDQLQELHASGSRRGVRILRWVELP